LRPFTFCCNAKRVTLDMMRESPRRPARSPSHTVPPYDDRDLNRTVNPLSILFSTLRQRTRLIGLVLLALALQPLA